MSDNNNEESHTKIMVFLARIEEKQENMHNDVTEMKIDVKKQNGRVRILEIKNGYLWGGLFVVGFIVPLIIEFVI